MSKDKSEKMIIRFGEICHENSDTVMNLAYALERSMGGFIKFASPLIPSPVYVILADHIVNMPELTTQVQQAVTPFDQIRELEQANNKLVNINNELFQMLPDDLKIKVKEGLEEAIA